MCANNFEPTDHVRCVKGDKSAGLEEGREYVVAVVVAPGYADFYGQHDNTGLIVWGVDDNAADRPCYPYVWDCDRFEHL